MKVDKRKVIQVIIFCGCAFVALLSLVSVAVLEDRLVNKTAELQELQERHNDALVDLAIERVSHQTTTNMCIREVEYWQLKSGVQYD
jgi:hypothetical protein